MRPLIVLIGRNGQVGWELSQLLPLVGELVGFSRSELDLSTAAAIRAAVRDIRPQIIVNAAAYTAVDAAENDRAAACAINAEAPAILAEEANRIEALLVHYSTDYVFDGSKSAPYEESDATAPINVYGETKLAGEHAIRDSGARHFVFRTSWVYSTRGKNFLRTILRLATEKNQLRVVRDQVGSPTWSHEIAAATARILAMFAGKNNRQTLAEAVGTYHMTAAGQTSWCDFARAILDETHGVAADIPWLAEATAGKPLIARDVVPISTKDYPTPAARPACSVLSNVLFRRTFGFALPDWRVQLRDLFAPNREQQDVIGFHA